MGDLINKLSDDCLRHIFSFLDISERLKVGKVCKRWRNVDEKGWPDKTKMTLNHRSDNMIHAILKRCGCFLEKLKIRLSSENPDYLPMVMKYCKLEQLETIEIHCEPDSTEDLEMRNLRKIIGRAKNLTVIKIYGDLEEYWMDYLNLANPTTLRELVIMNQNERILFSPDRFSNLKELTLRNIVIEEDEITSEKESLKGLEIISIKNCFIPGNLIQRIQNFINLQDLFLKDNICDIRSDDIREIASHCDKIKVMTLIATSSLTSTCFQYLGKMPKLENLYLGGLTIVHNLDMVHLTNVRELAFDSCVGIPMDDGLIHLITKSSNLEELSLIQIRDFDATFIDDVQLIFHCGLKQKHLCIYAWINDSDELIGHTFPIEINEPLLSLRVYLHE